jgi:hypothetical protein
MSNDASLLCSERVSLWPPSYRRAWVERVSDPGSYLYYSTVDGSIPHDHAVSEAEFKVLSFGVHAAAACGRILDESTWGLIAFAASENGAQRCGAHAQHHFIGMLARRHAHAHR